MPDPIDIKFAIGLPPEKAIEYFRSKGNKFSWAWQEMWQQAHARAFTVAKVTRLDILQDIREAVDAALAEGKTFREFQKELAPVLRKKGWWGKVLAKDVPGFDPESDQDPDEEIQLGSPYRLRTIYSANMQTALMAGRYDAQIQNTDDRPYWMYVAILDVNTRPSHAALHGRIYRYDDPFWDTFYPPNGWNCFPEDTPVATPNGWKAINKIKVGDSVIGGSGNIQTVQFIHANHFKGNMIRVSGKGFRATATPNHRILTLRGWIRAENLKIGDVLIQIPEIPVLDIAVDDVNHKDAFGGNAAMTLPAGAELPVGHSLIEVEQPEGFASGSPLDLFYSPESFRRWAFSHAILRKITGVENIPFDGIVYNLEVANDESYCIPAAVVHNCRCRVRTLSEKNIIDRKLSVEDSAGKTFETDQVVSKRTGETIRATGIRVQIKGGKQVKVIPDAGWGYNPGQAAFEVKLENYDPALREAYLKEDNNG